MKNQTLIALSIIIAGGLVAGAVIMNANQTNPPIAGSDHTTTQEHAPDSFRTISENDFIYGNPDAKVTVVEFSDYECPFCSRLHPALKELVDSRPDDVNWVYRDFPVHKEAWNTSYAANCVGQIAGNDAFWQYSDIMFENQRNLDQDFYVETAQKFGVSETDLSACMATSEVQDTVQSHYTEAQRSGARGTPFSIVITNNGQLMQAPGALPLETWHQVVDQALEN